MSGGFLHRLLGARGQPQPEMDADLALAALMVRAARTDGAYSDKERTCIDHVLADVTRLGPFEIADLRRRAEEVEARAADTVRFTRALKAAAPPEERGKFMRALWAVVLADRERDAEEDQLMRLVAGLLGLTDVQSAEARQQVQKQERDAPDAS